MKDIEYDSALNMAHAIADLMLAADEDQIRNGTLSTAAWCIVKLLDVVQEENERQCQIAIHEHEKRQAEELEAHQHRDRVDTYLSPSTSEEARAVLETLIQVGDIKNVVEGNARVQKHLSDHLEHLNAQNHIAEQFLERRNAAAGGAA